MDAKLAEGCIKAILTKYGDPIVNRTKSFVKDGWEKFKIDFDFVFLDYLNNACQKYGKIKTILYKTEPKDLHDFFEAPKLRKKDNIEPLKKDINDIWQISNFLIIQGSGGIGKSTLMKYIFLNASLRNDFIPVFIELKDLNDIQGDYEISDLIFEKLCNLGSSLDKTYLDYALGSGSFLFFLDGYDEILSENRTDFYKKISDFCDKYSENHYIISSRPYSEFVELQRFSVLEICAFDKKQAISLISKIDYDADTKQRFIKELDRSLYDTHRSFASNPLLLNIMLLTYDNYAEIPQKLHLFYENAFETLYFKHDATKGGYKRELKSNLTYDLFKKIFSEFCFMTYFQGKIELTRDELVNFLKKTTVKDIDFSIDKYIDDLVNSVCVVHKDGLTYKFTHRSFQEYFTSVFLKELSDNNMCKMGVKLFKKDTFRAVHDNVFNMLYDMTKTRTEQNIFLPLLDELESGNQCQDKYDYIFEKFNPIVHVFEKSPDGNERLAIRVYSGEEIVQFFRQFVYNYYKLDSEKISSATPKLLKRLKETKEYQENNEIKMLDYKENEEIYSLFKDTWAGTQIKTISEMSIIIRKQQTEEEIDLTELLEI